MKNWIVTWSQQAMSMLPPYTLLERQNRIVKKLRARLFCLGKTNQ
jgi:hypothetical protein